MDQIQPTVSETNSIPANQSKPLPRAYDKKKHGKRYPPAVKLAMRALKGSVSAEQAAVLSGCDRETIVRAWEDPELNELAPSVVRTIKTGLGGLFYKRALESSLAISAEKLSQSSALQLATVAGIMTEKGRLMEGLSTDNISFKGVTQSIEEDRNKIMKRIAEINGDTVEDRT